MRFRLEQRFSATIEEEVEAAFVDPGLLSELVALPQLGRPELISQHDDGTSVRQQVRYAFTGALSSAVTAVVDPKGLTLVEHSELDRRSHRTVFHITPDHYPDRLTCAGTTTLEPDAGGTRRVVEGDLRVRFPLVGSKVERAIVAWLDRSAP